jgi:hypothetical protein
VGTRHGLSDVCLIDSLNSLGVDVPYHTNGPFYALRDGLPLLQPFGLQLKPVQYTELTYGKYVKWYNNHFTGVVIGEKVTEFNNDVTKEYATVLDMGRFDQTRWFQLTQLDQTKSTQVDQTQSTQVDQTRRSKPQCLVVDTPISTDEPLTCAQRDTVRLNKAKATLKRKLAHERYNCLQRPTPPLHWALPSIPTSPSDFSSLDPLPQMEFLAVLNSHPRDACIQFYADSHTYLLNGRKSNGSVTGLIHQFVHPFNEDDIIPKMMSGRHLVLI